MSNSDLTTPREVLLDRAKTSLTEVTASMDLDPDDREKFADQIRQVEEMMAKLESGVIHIAAFGMVSRGKSALLNALLGQDVFETGATHGTTRSGQAARWSIRKEKLADQIVETVIASAKPAAVADASSIERGPDEPLTRIGADVPSLPCGEPPTSVGADVPTRKRRNITDDWADPRAMPTGPAIELIDTPGINEIGGEERARLAAELARRADLILFVVSGDMLRPEHEALAELRELQKPIILVFNKVDLYPQADRDKIYDKLRSDRVRELLKPEDVVLAAAKPRPVRIITKHPDGTTSESWEAPPPLIEPLKLKILDVLEREGQALAALNTLLYVDDLHEKIIERRVQLRDEAAEKLIWRFTVTKAVAVACNPVAVADVAGGIGTDLAMVIALSRLYGIPMTRVGVGKLVIEVGKMAGLFTATEAGTHLLIGMAKSLFAATTLFTGGASVAAYAAVAPIQAFAAGYSSRIIGEAAKTYLRNGASWGPAGPKRVIEHILSTLDKDSIMARIRDELRTRLGMSNSQ